MSGERIYQNIGRYPFSDRSRFPAEPGRQHNILQSPPGLGGHLGASQPHILQRGSSLGPANSLAEFSNSAHLQRNSHPLYQQLAMNQLQQPSQFQRLKVEDALSYLDDVKLQFSMQPQIYNDFLDIMKEFKSQSIDTPGVIRRVSELFQGHPDLIVGFNAFLPAGYKIELNSNDTIRLHQPGQKTISLYTGPPVALSSGGESSRAPLPLRVSTSSTSYDAPGRHLAGMGGGGGRMVGAVPDVVQDHQGGSSDAGQPVEFNHAINYVNKIKSRYLTKPDVYKAFLDILHAYQKEQREKEAMGQSSSHGPGSVSEKEVYSKVAVLFKDQPDLLIEFAQFLPDATGSSAGLGGGLSSGLQATLAEMAAQPKLHQGGPVGRKPSLSFSKPSPGPSVSTTSTLKSLQRRRLSGATSNLPLKKFKSESGREVTMAEASKFGSLGDFAFFDKVRKSLGDRSYNDLLKCLQLYNQRIINTTDLLLMIQPFFVKMPELQKKLKDLLKQKDDPSELPQMSHSKERMPGEYGGVEIDYASCKRLGVSYRGLPSTHIQPKCSGRTALCWEVLNDTLVSFPSWSEDSSSVLKKTMAEEQIFRCEEERYQLDIVLDNINATTLTLEIVQDKMNSMSREEAEKFRLDNCLGGTSETLHRKTIQRLYKEHAEDVIEGLKKNPYEVLPRVLMRLRLKQQQWAEARQNSQKNLNDQNQKYYLKSLDHQGINFKQTDMKQLRSKTLLMEIENAMEENQDQLNRPDAMAPVMTLEYPKRRFFEDAAALIIHHVKRQTGINQEDKQKIKHLVVHFIPQLFFLSPCNLSDVDSCKEEDEDEEKNSAAGDSCDDTTISETKSKERVVRHTKPSKPKTARRTSKEIKNKTSEQDEYDADDDERNDDDDDDDDDDKDSNAYTLMYGSNNWYLFLRLHNILYRRLKHFHHHAQVLLEEQRQSSREAVESTAVALGLKPPQPEKPVDYYPVFLEMIRNCLDGNLETSTYEEQLREIFSINAYHAFTMDKLIQSIVRQLQHLVMDQICIQVTDLYRKEKDRLTLIDSVLQSNQRQQAELAYQKKAEQMLIDENCFRIIFYKSLKQLTLSLIDSTDSAGGGEERWRDYVEQFVTTDEQSDSLRALLLDNPIALMRNIRAGRKSDRPLLNTGDGGAGEGGVECKFEVNSHKMNFVENSSTASYRVGSLARAKRTHGAVSTRMHRQMSQLVDDWVKVNVSEQEHKACRDWFMGNVEGLNPSRKPTECISMGADLSLKPYHKYHVYSTMRSAV